VRTEGGHRRYSRDDVTVLHHVLAMIDTGVATGAAVAAARATRQSGAEIIAASPGELEQAFVAAIDRLDATAALAVVDALLARRGLAPAWDETFVPYLRDLGQAWRRNGEAIEREHLAVGVLFDALAKYREAYGKPARGDAPLVVLVATDHERHTLPLHVLDANLRARGTRVCTVGHVPAQTLRRVVTQLEPAAVVLWARCQHADDIAELRSVRRNCAVVHAAGPGWSRNRLPRKVEHLDSLSSALLALEVL
jgi:DNA-binding transcriptional MerR regulator